MEHIEADKATETRLVICSYSSERWKGLIEAGWRTLVVVDGQALMTSRW